MYSLVLLLSPSKSPSPSPQGSREPARTRADTGPFHPSSNKIDIPHGTTYMHITILSTHFINTFTQQNPPQTLSHNEKRFNFKMIFYLLANKACVLKKTHTLHPATSFSTKGSERKLEPYTTSLPSQYPRCNKRAHPLSYYPLLETRPRNFSAYDDCVA